MWCSGMKDICFFVSGLLRFGFWCGLLCVGWVGLVLVISVLV